jgi:Helix-turn-helix domain
MKTSEQRRPDGTRPTSGAPEALPAPAADMHANTRWFHMFHAMIDAGEVARMGCSTFTVYAVIKAYTNLQTGAAFPGVETIAEKCGLSRMQVWRALQILGLQALLKVNLRLATTNYLSNGYNGP